MGRSIHIILPSFFEIIKNQKRATLVVAFCFVIGFLILIDQLTKTWVFNHPNLNLKLIVSNKIIIAVTYFYNNNFAFSLAVPIQIIYLIYFIILVIIFSYLIKKFKIIPIKELFGWALILAGAFSNIAERIINGAVRDFIYLIGGGIINFADLFILIGLVIVILFSSNKKSLE